MATRGRFKGWKSAKAIAVMTPEEKVEYDALVARVKAERDAEKIAKGINVEEHEAKKKEAKEKKEEKQINLQNLINSQLEYQKTHIMSQDEDEEEKNGKPWYESNNGSGDYKETSIDHLSGEGFCIIETNEDFWIRKIAEMIEKTPNKVIICDNFNSEDTIRVKIPYSCMKKIKTSTRTVSEEQRQRMSELGKQATGRKRGRPRKNSVENPVENSTENPTDIPTEDPVENINETIDETIDENSMEIPDTQVEETVSFSSVNESATSVNDDEESDEEFENTPMNKFIGTPVQRFLEIEEDNEEEVAEQENTEAEDIDEDTDENFTYCNFGTMSFGDEPVYMRLHIGPEDAPNDDLDKYFGEE